MTNSLKTLLICFLLTGTSAILMSNTKGGNMKMWSASEKLKWTDYKDSTSKTRRVGQTYSTIIVEPKEAEDKMMDVKIYSAMDRDRSWADTAVAKRTDYALSHEQYHFNITEYWARKMRKDAAKSKMAAKSAKEKLEEMRKEYMDKCKEMQTAYDEETKHGGLKAEQKKWEEKIDGLFKGTEDQESPAITLDLK